MAVGLNLKIEEEHQSPHAIRQPYSSYIYCVRMPIETLIFIERVNTNLVYAVLITLKDFLQFKQ